MPKDLNLAITQLIERLSSAESISESEAINLLRSTRELKSALMLEIKEKVPLKNDKQSATADRLYEIKTSLNEDVQRISTRLKALEKREKEEVKEEWASFSLKYGTYLGSVSFMLNGLKFSNKEALAEKEEESAEDRLKRLKKYQKEATKSVKEMQSDMDEAEELLRIQLRDHDPEKKKLFDRIVEAQKELDKLGDEDYKDQLNKITAANKLILQFETSYLN